MERKCFEPSTFFQVTINSTKLISIINQLSATTREHDTTIQQNHLICTESIAHFATKIQQLQKKFEQKVQNIQEKAAHQQSERTRYDQILNRKIDKNHEQHNNQITTLCEKIYKFNDKLENETFEARKQVKNRFEQLRQGMQPQLCRLQQQIDRLQNQIKILSQNTTQEIEKLTTNVNQDKNLFQSIGLQLMDKEKLKSVLQQEKRIQLQKSQKKNDASQTLKFASFLAKLQTLQKRIQEKQNQNINKVMYPSRANKCRRKTIFVQSKEDICDGKSRTILQQSSIVNQQVEEGKDMDDQSCIVQIHMNISKKLGKIEQLFNDKINSIMKQLSYTKNKISVLEEKVGIVSRKSEKYYMTMNEVKDKLKKFQEKKIDEKYYDVLKGQLKRFGKEIQDMMEKKLSISNFEKEKTKLYEKISVIHQNLTEKAEKGEIKNAFLFLEGKIKQLILIIAKDQVTQKQGFMTKTALKCLSCDKQVQFQLRSNRILSSKRGKSQNTLRAATGHAKRRVQIMSNIMSPIKAIQ